MRKPTVISLILILVSCQTAPKVQRPELVLIPNPGFEAPKGDWIQDWELLSGATGAAGRDAKVFHSGSASLRLTGPAWVGSRMMPYNGEEINLSAWLRTEAVKGGKYPWARPGISINGYDEAGKPVVSRDVVRLDGTRPWQKYELHCLLSSAVRRIRVMCFMIEGAQGTAWFDDIDLTLREWRDKTALGVPYDEGRCTVEVAADKPLGRINPVWNGADAGLAESTTLEPVRSILPRLRAAGISFLRIRETINGLRIYSEDAKGKPSYEWGRFDHALDIPVKLGFKLIFVLGTTPDEMALRIGQRPGRNTSPPKNLQKWADLVSNVVKHCEERYGKATVESWYWELWNKPDSPQFFSGSLAEYLALYDCTARAIKQVNPKLRVGGPSSETDTWLQSFAAHCAGFQNIATGEMGIPVDFFSWHIFSSNRGPAAIDMIDYSIKQARTFLARYPSLQGKELLVTEWNISPPPNDLADTNYTAAFAARSAERLLDLGISRACFFRVADSPLSPYEVFKGDLGMVTSTGVEKPVLNAFQVLSMLGPVRLTMTVGGAEGEAAVGPVSGIATASADGQRIGILLSNYVDDPEADFSTDTTVKFTGLPFPAGELRFRRYLIDASRSNAFDQWLSLGKPDKPTALEIRGLRRDAQLELFQEKVVTVAEDGTLSAAMRLPAHSVTLIELERIAGKPGK